VNSKIVRAAELVLPAIVPEIPRYHLSTLDAENAAVQCA